jgi:nitrogen regulatory protein PII
VKESLDASEFSLTVTDVKVRDGREEIVHIYRGIRYRRDLLPKLQVSTIVPDEDVGEVAATIARAGRVSEITGSKVFAVPVEELYGSELKQVTPFPARINCTNVDRCVEY